ncbi:translation initiation factor IF-2 [[Clostridium] colinum]|uniref:translation initiation factor IF-2 n=1 Tax=[Clostridium] colinum TaxID=36835 RepID=UPI0038CD1162
MIYLGKIRVHELRKKISETIGKDIENKELIDKLSEFGIEVKSHSSSIEEKDVDFIIEYYLEENSPKEEVKEDKIEEKKSKQNKKEGKKEKKAMTSENSKNENEDIKIIQIEKSITVKELAEKIGTTSSDLVMRLMKRGMMVNLNQEIDFELASSICEEFDILTEEAPEIDILEETFKEEEENEEDLTERPPVVVVMGHVDHGKTSLLDSIRKSRVTEKEAGGITQHIGAYTVSIDDKPITFLDTPGHEAFTAMRMRGASVTDIAILVVAADDGVMPQTIEAINHAKAAGVEIIVAINKMDKESANPDRVKQELTEYGLLAEDWGGDTICVPVSAVTKQGIDNLLEMIILVAEMKELKANHNKKARGTVIEAKLDKGRGPVATILVQSGTLKVGDPIVAGSTYGKIRAMMNDKGQKVKSAGPSIPVEILGLSEVPSAGDSFYVAKSDKQARQVAEAVIAKDRVDMIKSTSQKVSLDDLFTQIQSGNMKELNIVIKADVQGSVEAVRSSLEKLSNEEVRIRTIHGGVGAITESDVMLASASNAIIIGFNVRPENTAKSVAEDQKVDVRLYRVIYNAIEDITAAMKGMLDPVYEEKVIGHAEIRQIFKASGVGTIGGSYVTDGKIVRNSQVRIIRDGIVVYEGELAALRRFKDDVKEVNAGYECGLLFNKFNDIKEGDQVEAFVMEQIPH